MSEGIVYEVKTVLIKIFMHMYQCIIDDVDVLQLKMN